MTLAVWRPNGDLIIRWATLIATGQVDAGWYQVFLDGKPIPVNECIAFDSPGSYEIRRIA